LGGEGRRLGRDRFGGHGSATCEGQDGGDGSEGSLGHGQGQERAGRGARAGSLPQRRAGPRDGGGCMTPQGAGRRVQAAERGPEAVAALLGAIPFPCAAFARDGGTLVAANDGYRRAFAGLAGHDRRDALVAALPGAAEGDGEGAREVHAPHSNRWYALHWGGAEVDGEA